MTFSILQGCDGQAIAVDLRTDVHHPHHRHPRLLRAHRRHPHAPHRRVADPVQHPDAMSGMTDDVIDGKIEESQFRPTVVCVVGSLLTGKRITQFFLVPSTVVIVGAAKALKNRP